MTRKSTGDYPENWPEIARAVKDEAGWCCVRCGHLHEPETGHTLTLGSMPFGPIMFDVARSAETHEVAQGVRFAVAVKSEIPKRNDVRNREFFGQIIPMPSAMLAAVTISMASLVPLILPVWAVIGDISALPVRTQISGKMSGEPSQAASVRAKSLRCLASRNRPLFPAHLTLIRHAVRCAGSRAITTARCMGRLSGEWLATPLTVHCDVLRRIYASLRTVDLLFNASSGAAEKAATPGARLRDLVILASSRAIDAPIHIPWRDAKWLIAARTNLRGHAGILSYQTSAEQIPVVMGGGDA